MKTLERIRGCLFGLAIGDALGAPVEFLGIEGIRERFGPEGITDFAPCKRFEAGSFTDDTQMSLATAQGILDFFSQGNPTSMSLGSFVYKRYLQWLESQADPKERRGPGRTCLSALQSGIMGTVKQPINDSKGCGGVMRTAPVGLAFPPVEAFELGAELAAITHGHPSGYLSAGFLSMMVSLILEEKTLDEAFDLATEHLITYPEHQETLGKVRLARELASASTSPLAAISRIGGGWVGEEALAIAVYCCSKFPDDWKSAVLAAVNHSGDSDSTGSITGGLAGVILGIGGIPEEWVSGVEDASKIQRYAEAFLKNQNTRNEVPPKI